MFTKLIRSRRLSVWVIFLSVALSLTGWAADGSLRPGDTIDLKLGGVPSNETSAVSGEYMIDTGGYINLPNLGKLKIAGLTTGVAQTAIENAYKAREVYTNPTIIITMQAQSRWVNVGGEVKSPQRVPFTPDLTILASINAAGGFSPFADQRKVRLLRGSQVMIIDVKKIRSNPSLDIGLEPGDRVEVPQTIF